MVTLFTAVISTVTSTSLLPGTGSTSFPGMMVNEMMESGSLPTKLVLTAIVTFTVKYCRGSAVGEWG